MDLPAQVRHFKAVLRSVHQRERLLYVVLEHFAVHDDDCPAFAGPDERDCVCGLRFLMWLWRPRGGRSRREARDYFGLALAAFQQQRAAFRVRSDVHVLRAQHDLLVEWLLIARGRPLSAAERAELLALRHEVEAQYGRAVRAAGEDAFHGEPAHSNAGRWRHSPPDTQRGSPPGSTAEATTEAITETPT